MKNIVLTLIACLLSFGAAEAKNYNIADYGVVSDTMQLASPAINAAIQACSADGGGRVVVPAGQYRCGTIFMKSHVELHLESGAYVYATEGYADFPMQPRNHYRSQKDAAGWNALIYAADAEGIALTGDGVVDGRGQHKHGNLKNVPSDGNGRPKNVLFISCKKVKVSGVTIKNSPMWNQHYLNCEDVIVDGIHSWNHCNGNNDGIDIDGCRRFVLSNSIIDSDDDGIVLKSTGPAPCEDVIVRGCIVSSYANAIKCGTESTGGFRDILISDCVVKPSRNTGKRVLKSTPSGISAISLEIVDGGIMENVSVSNILINGTECPIYVRLGNRARKYMPETAEPQVGIMRDISINGIQAYEVGNFCSSITGIEGHCVENISLSNIIIENRGGLAKGNYRTTGDDKGVRHDMAGNKWGDAYWQKSSQVKEDDKGYPQPTVWGNLPSRGLFARHVRGLSLNNVTFRSAQSDPRQDIIKVDVK